MAVKGFLKASGTPRRTFSTSVAGSRGGDLFAGLRVEAWAAMAANGIDSHRMPSVKRVVVIDLDLRGCHLRSFRRNALPDPDSPWMKSGAGSIDRAAPDHFFWMLLSSCKVGQWCFG